MTKNLTIIPVGDFETFNLCFSNEKHVKINLKNLSQKNFRAIITSVHYALDELLKFRFLSGEMCQVEPFDEMYFVAKDLWEGEKFIKTVNWIVDIIKDERLGTDNDFYIVIMEDK